MLTSIEATIDKEGVVRLKEPVRLARACRAIVFGLDLGNSAHSTEMSPAAIIRNAGMAGKLISYLLRSDPFPNPFAGASSPRYNAQQSAFPDPVRSHYNRPTLRPALQD